MNNLSKVLACPVCNNHFSHVLTNNDTRNVPNFGYGLDYRLVPRDCNRASDVATCPNCFFSYRTQDFDSRVSENIKSLVKSKKYSDIFKSATIEDLCALGRCGMISILETRGLNPRDLGIVSLKSSWVARELGSTVQEMSLLENADKFLDDALRRNLTKGEPAMVMYLLGEINRRREEYLRAKEMLTFLGNNPRYRYPALLLTVLIEEEDSTPYWSNYSPDKMEQLSPRFKGIFPALRSIPPLKVDFSPDELNDAQQKPDEDDRQRF
ncbi:MAG: DUF2225 domain-containing protein [Syntrophaceae bacterium]|nr:DUF2225 domain-containing protein [Syntrophaceae bacterium]